MAARGNERTSEPSRNEIIVTLETELEELREKRKSTKKSWKCTTQRQFETDKIDKKMEALKKDKDSIKEGRALIIFADDSGDEGVGSEEGHGQLKMTIKDKIVGRVIREAKKAVADDLGGELANISPENHFEQVIQAIDDTIKYTQRKRKDIKYSWMSKHQRQVNCDDLDKKLKALKSAKQILLDRHT